MKHWCQSAVWMLFSEVFHVCYWVTAKTEAKEALMDQNINKHESL